MGRNTIIEAHGEFPGDRFNTNVKIMDDLWNEIAELADFDKNGEVDVDEFKQAVMKHCVGKSYAQFPKAFKAFIENQFKAVDVDGDGHVGLPEYRADAITRSAFTDVAEIDAAYAKLVSPADTAAGGISLDRYKELYAQFIGSEAECPAMYLFGPLKSLNPDPAYTHDNRVKYVVRYLYDIDNNGVLDKNDFKCLAVRNTILEAKGEFPSDRFATNCKIMDDLWNVIALLADFKAAVQVNCVNKNYDQFPPMFKTFIENQFKAVDINSDGTVGLDEYRQDVITRGAYTDVKEIDDAFNKLVNDSDKAAGGIPLARYKELYAQFIGSKEEGPYMFLFGPLKEL